MPKSSDTPLIIIDASLADDWFSDISTIQNDADTPSTYNLDIIRYHTNYDKFYNLSVV